WLEQYGTVNSETRPSKAPNAPHNNVTAKIDVDHAPSKRSKLRVTAYQSADAKSPSVPPARPAGKRSRFSPNRYASLSPVSTPAATSAIAKADSRGSSKRPRTPPIGSILSTTAMNLIATAHVLASAIRRAGRRPASDWPSCSIHTGTDE